MAQKTFSQLLEADSRSGAPVTDPAQLVEQAAARFHEALSGTVRHKAKLEEAFTTSDFSHLLGAAFGIDARASYREVNDETRLLTMQRGVPDLRRRKLSEFFGETYFDDVNEGEEYKSDNPFEETEIEHGTGKTGRAYGLTFEKFLTGDFSDLADFPGMFGRGAANTRNRKIFQTLVDPAGGLSSEAFSTVSDQGLSFETLKTAKAHITSATNSRGDGLVDGSSLVLLVVPGLGDQARSLVAAQGVRETFGVGTRTQRELQTGNPLTGIQVQESYEFARLLDPSLRGSAWALVPAGTTRNPLVIHSYLNGHQEVDIRVKNDQGSRPGGGVVSFQEGSFDDDTIWYRGRYFVGGDLAYTNGTYASTGTATPE